MKLMGYLGKGGFSWEANGDALPPFPGPSRLLPPLRPACLR